ncbi:hypothetical protein EVAR_12014_1 [Eumeta japonica]|uniref:Uncharacterized protein n=1 Tax=Eumeta variegata TaxID=151549 RepID=A0A4C1U4U9_EUMVA|nr:hypothetical protein EVAR_12014_1 [Eumeta japonica]
MCAVRIVENNVYRPIGQDSNAVSIEMDLLQVGSEPVGMRCPHCQEEVAVLLRDPVLGETLEKRGTLLPAVRPIPRRVCADFVNLIFTRKGRHIRADECPTAGTKVVGGLARRHAVRQHAPTATPETTVK